MAKSHPRRSLFLLDQPPRPHCSTLPVAPCFWDSGHVLHDLALTRPWRVKNKTNAHPKNKVQVCSTVQWRNSTWNRRGRSGILHILHQNCSRMVEVVNDETVGRTIAGSNRKIHDVWGFIAGKELKTLTAGWWSMHNFCRYSTRLGCTSWGKMMQNKTNIWFVLYESISFEGSSFQMNR